MSDLKNIMQNIEVDLGDHWLCPNRYTGTKEDLIAAKLAKQYMFAELPKRVKDGCVDCNGWPIDGHPFDYGDKYDPLGKSRAIYWSTKRVKGGKFRLNIDKSWEETQQLRSPPHTPDSFLDKVSVEAIAYAIAIKMLADGGGARNPQGYYLSKNREIGNLVHRLMSAIKTSTVVIPSGLKPFDVIDGDKP